MRFPLIMLAAIAALPATASAQSLTDTHERVWSPAGKTPAVHYRPLGAKACTTARAAHPWTKGHTHATAKCGEQAEVAQQNANKAAKAERPGT